MSERVVIKRIPSGVPGLDEVLGGGLPEYSFTLIAGGPGCGKTTLADQILFANATPEQPALHITILGEPPLKMLRYQQQFSFFDVDKVPNAVRFLHLGSTVLESGLDKVLEQIVEAVEDMGPRMVVVDSFRAMTRKAMEAGQIDLEHFVQRLSLHLTSWEATTFLVGEYQEREAEGNPIFTVADGIIWLSQATQRNSVVRKLRVLKMRGQSQLPGLHTMKILDSGLRVFPRLPSPERADASSPPDRSVRRKMGIEAFDAMLGGGIPVGYSVMVVGPSGSGKTTLAVQFVREGIERGEPGVIAVFEKRPEDYLITAPDGVELGKLIEQGTLRMLSLRPLDLSVDETMEEIASAVRSIGAKRLVVDSLSGFELALAPSFREDFRESLYRMVGALASLGVTVMMTAELVDSYTELRLSPPGISFLTDGIILQRYAEMAGHLRRVMVVAKMRGIEHKSELRLYDISADGIVMGAALTDHEHVLTGVPRRITPNEP